MESNIFWSLFCGALGVAIIYDVLSFFLPIPEICLSFLVVGISFGGVLVFGAIRAL